MQFPFTTSEADQDYYHQTVNIGVASRGAEQLWVLENKKNSRKRLKCLQLKESTQWAAQKENFDSCARKLRKISCKTFPKKNNLLDFTNLSLFGPRL